MVIIGGGWGSGRGGYGPFGRRGYGRRYGGGGGCLRDACLVESGCCLAEAVGCGPQLALLAPVLAFRAVTGRSQGRHADAPVGPRAQALALGLIHAYQTEISPRRTRPCCRYTPTCSAYAAQALETYGLLRGLRLTAARLLRCRPGSRGGHDPVPT